MDLKIIPLFKNSVTDKQLKRFEDVIGYKLPQNYINFLHKYNGTEDIIKDGKSARDLELLIKPKNINDYPKEEHNYLEFSINFMYGFQSDNEAEQEPENDGYELFEIYKTFKDRMPSNFIPIAEDQGGNQFILDVSPQNSGKIHFWDMEMCDVEEGEKPTDEYIVFLVDSIDEFFEKLEPDQE